MESLYRTGLSNAATATALALVVACLGRFLWRRPAVLHCLWLLVLLKLVAPPVFEVPMAWLLPVTAAHEPELGANVTVLGRPATVAHPINPVDIVIEVADGPPASFDSGSDDQFASTSATMPAIEWTRAACVLWIAGTLVTLIASIARICQFQRHLSEAEPADHRTQAEVDTLAVKLGLKRGPSVWWVEGQIPPMIWPVGWRPRLILPRPLWKSLDNRQRSTLIIHELAHLCRGDHQLRIFELIVTALYWWHPVLWWARRAMRIVEEQCCDAWVVWAQPGAGKSYADTLLLALDFLSLSDRSQPLLATGFGQFHQLRKRLTMIMNGRTPRMLGMWGALGLLGLALVLLPVSPSWAEKPEEKKEVRIVVDTDDVADATANATAKAGTTAHGQSSTVEIRVDDDADKSKPGKASVVVTSDGEATAILADSTDEAIKKLKKKIDEIAAKSSKTDRDKALQKALGDALRDLERAVAKPKMGHLREDKALQKSLEDALKDLERAAGKPKMGHLSEKAAANAAHNKEAVLRKVYQLQSRATSHDLDRFSDEQKAELKKAFTTVDRLREQLRSTQRELAEAQLRLAKLTAAGAHRTRYVMVKPDPEAPPARDAAIREKRLAGLEKQLKELLDEVVKLKEERSK